MGKYTETNAAVLSFFGTTEWIAEGLPTVPSNFVGDAGVTEYLRVTIMPHGKSVSNPLISTSGIVLIEIFSAAGSGPTRSAEIADVLDNHLSGRATQHPVNLVQFGPSSLSDGGKDKANANLYRILYTIPFNYFGVQ